MVEMVHEQLSEYPVDILEAAGHQLDDLILSCIYDTEECLWVWWEWFNLKVTQSPVCLEPWLSANQTSAQNRECDP